MIRTQVEISAKDLILTKLKLLICNNWRIKLKPSKAPMILECTWKLPAVGMIKINVDGFSRVIQEMRDGDRWGPPSAMVEGHSPISNQGIVSRIFQMLFTEIQEQENSEDKHINYQCRCSFLE
ncbi:Kinesin, partial [Thalictrum thalictroides]